MNYKEEFSKRLIQLREQKGLTQQQLADELKITRQSLSLYEKAERTINIELLAKIADFFNTSTDYLMGRTDTSSMNENIQAACKVTGLNESAIKGIKKYFKLTSEHENNRLAADVANAFFENQHFSSMLYYLFSLISFLDILKNKYRYDNETVIRWNEGLVCDYIVKKDFDDLCNEITNKLAGSSLDETIKNINAEEMRKYVEHNPSKE